MRRSKYFVLCIFTIERAEDVLAVDSVVLHVVVKLKVDAQGEVVVIGVLGAYGSKDEPYAPLPGRNNNDLSDP